MANKSLKNYHFDKKKLLQNVVASFNMLLLTPSELKLVDYLLQNQSLKWLEKSTFEPFSFRIDLNYKSLGNSNNGCGVINRPILALKVSKEAF